MLVALLNGFGFLLFFLFWPVSHPDFRVLFSIPSLSWLRRGDGVQVVFGEVFIRYWEELWWSEGQGDLGFGLSE